VAFVIATLAQWIIAAIECVTQSIAESPDRQSSIGNGQVSTYGRLVVIRNPMERWMGL
jgi:hypothetical protein